MITADAALIILIHRDMAPALGLYRVALSMFAVITGVTRAGLYEMFPGYENDWCVRLLADWGPRPSVEHAQDSDHVSADLDSVDLINFMAQDRISMVMIPLITAGRWWGFVRLEDSRPDYIWEAAEVNALRQVAHQIEFAISQHHLPHGQPL